MRQFARYVWLVVRRCFEGMFLLADGFGLFLIFLSKSQPNVPIEISLGLFGIIFVGSTFSVWRDEVKKHDKLQAKLSQIKNDIPRYELTAGALETYTLTSLIDRCSQDLNKAETEIARQSALEASNSSAATFFKAINKLSVLPIGLASETKEEKAERLSKHLTALEKYAEKMKQTYKVPLVFESTRADSNIEFEVEAPEGVVLIVKDDHPSQEIPQTYTPSFGRGELASYIPSGGFVSSNRLYPYSYAEAHMGYSKLTKINANRKYNLFDEDFYIQTDLKSVELKVTIHSEKLQKQQILKVAINLDDAVTEEIADEVADE